METDKHDGQSDTHDAVVIRGSRGGAWRWRCETCGATRDRWLPTEEEARKRAAAHADFVQAESVVEYVMNPLFRNHL